MDVDNITSTSKSYSEAARDGQPSSSFKNVSKTLYTDPLYNELLNHSRELNIWRRSFDSNNVIFYTKKSINKIPFLTACKKQIDSIDAVTHTVDKQHNSSYEILFSTPEAKELALTKCLSFQNELFIAQPLMNPETKLFKVNLYGIPNTSLSSLTEPLGAALSLFGRATVFLDVSNQTYQPLTRKIYLHGKFDCFIQARWKNMPAYCRYCREEGHLKKNCPVLDEYQHQIEQQQQQQQLEQQQLNQQ